MNRKFALVSSVVALVAVGAAPAWADHEWKDASRNPYHWARTANPFTLHLDNNLTTVQWRDIGLSSTSEWSTRSSMLEAPLSGPKTDNKRCKASSGRVEICNGKFGFNGWLGVAQIWISGGHIVQGTAKMNDSYLASSSYSATAKQHVLCQEVGHTFGLDHQDVTGADLNTCMDYATALDNPSPDDKDISHLDGIYASHTDATSTVAPTAAVTAARGPMRRVRDDLYVEDLGAGTKIYTFVSWVERRLPHDPPAVD